MLTYKKISQFKFLILYHNPLDMNIYYQNHTLKFYKLITNSFLYSKSLNPNFKEDKLFKNNITYKCKLKQKKHNYTR